MPLSAQRDLLSRADSLHRAFRFEEAAGLYLSAGRDDKAAVAQNALNMTEFCADVHVVARQRFSRRDFFLFYPLKPLGWHASPNPLDTLEGYPTYAPKGADVIYFSTVDRAGTRSIFVTEDLDSLWRAPRLAGEGILSTGSEIFPMLSQDEKTLYFASNGLYGMGGYDLYASAWDAETASWGDPVNLGFPYNSPADDFLLADSEDGKYTLFASNRDCSKDSVYVYVLERDPSPQRRPVRNYKDLQRLSRLDPVADPGRPDTGATAPEEPLENANTRLYKRKMEEARALRDSIYRNEKAVDALRQMLSESPELSADISARIRTKEQALAPLRKLLEEVNLEIRLVEQSFLQSGVASSASSAEKEVAGSGLSYTFVKRTMGSRLRMKVGRSSTTPSFRIMPIGRFAQTGTLPAGLVYQIEIFSSPRHATVEDLAGLSPVYERLSPSLRYTYSVGLYSRYTDALQDLNTVRKLGFPDARITAYRDGRAIPVRSARQEE